MVRVDEFLLFVNLNYMKSINKVPRKDTVFECRCVCVYVCAYLCSLAFKLFIWMLTLFLSQAITQPVGDKEKKLKSDREKNITKLNNNKKKNLQIL